jgi:CrcB protein
MRPDLRAVVAVAVGGAIGSVARYLVNLFIQGRVGADFPLGTLVINVAGSLLLGVLATIGFETTAFSAEVRLLLTTGFCGGFTTFSTFSLDTVQLMERREYERASLYVIASVGLSLLGTMLGIGAARRWLRASRTRQSPGA